MVTDLEEEGGVVDGVGVILRLPTGVARGLPGTLSTPSHSNGSQTYLYSFEDYINSYSLCLNLGSFHSRDIIPDNLNVPDLKSRSIERTERCMSILVVISS